MRAAAEGKIYNGTQTERGEGGIHPSVSYPLLERIERWLINCRAPRWMMNGSAGRRREQIYSQGT